MDEFFQYEPGWYDEDRSYENTGTYKLACFVVCETLSYGPLVVCTLELQFDPHLQILEI